MALYHYWVTFTTEVVVEVDALDPGEAIGIATDDLKEGLRSGWIKPDWQVEGTASNENF
jgi:hypothetical protein